MCNAYDSDTYHHPITLTKFLDKLCPKNEKEISFHASLKEILLISSIYYVGIHMHSKVF